MIVEIVIAIVIKVGESLLSPIGRQFRYVHRYKRNTHDLQQQVVNLVEDRDDVHQLVRTAEKKGEEIKTQVRSWLNDADEIIAEAQELDTKIQLKKLSSRFKLSKEALKKANAILELRGNAPTIVSFTAPPASIVDFISNEDFVAVKSSDSTMEKILEQLQDDDCEVIGVFGMGGIGKTTIVKEVGKKAMESNLFDIVLMAVVSQTPHVRKIQGQLLDTLGLKLKEESETGRASQLYKRLKNEERVLVILDDVWSKIDLAAIGIPRICKVIVTTRRKTVCSALGRKTKTICMNILPFEESWCLFKENARKIVDSSALRDVAIVVANECRGLPLALVTVARALRDKDIAEWKTALQHLKKSSVPMDIEDDEKDIFSCIKLSYDYLTSDEMKSCLSFCCMFPEDHEIKVEDLARFGMGKGLFREVYTMEEARIRAQCICKHLKASCLLLEGDQEEFVKVHDVVRDVVLAIMVKDNVDSFLVRAGSDLKQWPNINVFGHYTEISLMTNDIHKLPSNLNFPKLQVLLLGENEGFDKIPDSFFEEMPLLRVMDLSERIGFRSLLPSSSNPSRILTLPSSFKFLAHLRILHLVHCKIGDISVVGEVKTLEILSLYGSDIKELPKEIGELINLRVLDLSYCQCLQFIPSNLISRLLQLEELYIGYSFKEWQVEEFSEEKSKACLSELRFLTRLVILCVELRTMSCLPNNVDFGTLLKFEVSIGHGVLSVQCYPKSRSLHLREIKTPLSDAVKSLFRNADEASLFCTSGRTINDIDPAGLNDLKSIVIRGCSDMLYLFASSSTKGPPIFFANLEELHIRDMELPWSLFGRLPPRPSPSLSKLRVLKFQDYGLRSCPLLKFGLILLLQNLEEVAVENCGGLTTVFQLSKDYNEEHVLFSTLTKLRLVHLGRLMEMIWDDCSSKLVINPINLKFVEITSACALRYVFPFSVAQSLVKLETLDIQWCDKIQSVFDKAVTFGFPSLKIVRIESCNCLMSLFSVSTDAEVSFPRLKSLKLVNLPRLERLLSGNVSVDFPSLENLIIQKCDFMRNFADDPSSFGLKTAPKVMKLQVDGQIFDGEAARDICTGKVI